MERSTSITSASSSCSSDLSVIERIGDNEHLSPASPTSSFSTTKSQVCEVCSKYAGSDNLIAGHPFVLQMRSRLDFEELPVWGVGPKKPQVLDVSPTTWIARNSHSLVSVFHLGSPLCGWPDIIHGGVLAGIIDQLFAQYCHHAFPTQYPVTAKLTVNYRQPVFANGDFVARITTMQPPSDFKRRLLLWRPFMSNGSSKRSRKIWVQGHIETIGGKVVLVVAEALFILLDKSPERPNISVG